MIQPTPPPPTSSQPVDWLGWGVAISIPMISTAVAAWWAYRSKVSELERKNEVELAKLAAERDRAETEIVREHQRMQHEQQVQFYNRVIEEARALRVENRELKDRILDLQQTVKDHNGGNKPT